MTHRPLDIHHLRRRRGGLWLKATNRDRYETTRDRKEALPVTRWTLDRWESCHLGRVCGERGEWEVFDENGKAVE